MEISSRLNDAFRYMKSKHGLQKRKGNGELYWKHPKRVAGYVWDYKESYMIEDLLIIAMLHDVIEDTNGTAKDIEELFGSVVANTVLELTSVKKEMEESMLDKKEYLSKKMIAMSPYALVVKLCDRLDNIKSLSGMNDAFRFRQLTDTEYILEQIYKGRQFITGTHHILLHEIQKAMDAYNPQKNNPFAVPDDVDLGFEFDSIVNALDEKSKGNLAVEIGNMNTLIAKVRAVK